MNINFLKTLMTAKRAPTIADVSRQIDMLLESGQKPSEAIEVMKQATHPNSKLDVRDTDSDMRYVQSAAFGLMRRWNGRYRKLSTDRDDPNRDYGLADIWQGEPLMAGAIYSMAAKMTALKWAVTGRRLAAARTAEILATTAHIDGYDWGGFISSTAQDFYTTNRGSFWEAVRSGNPLYGKLVGLGHIDALCCELTGNKKRPMIYYSENTGQVLNFHEGEYIHFASLPSARERRLGYGFCAVDRALRALTLLMGLHDYDEEKLNNLPPEGIATVTGLTMDELLDAFTMWTEKRKQDNSLTYPQVLWLLGSQPNVEVKVAFSGFSQLPESFDRGVVIDQYVNILAMCFGVDAREFWPVSSGALGTASESEIQHLKAKGKGHGEIISVIERHINGELDAETQFAFDTQDIEEDMQAAAIAKAWVDAYYPLYSGVPSNKSKASPGGKPNTEAVPSSEEIPQESASGQAMSVAGPMGQPGGPEQVISKDELLRLLADKGVIPEWMLNDQRYRVEDNQIHIRQIGKEVHQDDFITITWDKGILKESRLPPIILWSPASSDIPESEPIEAGLIAKHNHNGHADLDAIWDWMKRVKEEAVPRNIRGKPISGKEVVRGASVTAKTIRDELERWRSDSVLKDYLPNEEEMAVLMASLEKAS